MLVDSLECAFDDREYVVEPRLQMRLCVNSLELERHTFGLCVGAHVQLDQIPKPGLEGDTGMKVVDLERNLLHGEVRYVEQDIGLSAPNRLRSAGAGVVASAASGVAAGAAAAVA
jgi:hypothetical protein